MLVFGWQEVLLIEAPLIVIAGTAGVWLFFVQHQFEDVYWENGDTWDYTEAALQGSSYLKLPQPFQFFTGNIGLHHVHHLSARVPNYNLQRAHDENEVFQQVPVLTFRQQPPLLAPEALGRGVEVAGHLRRGPGEPQLRGRAAGQRDFVLGAAILVTALWRGPDAGAGRTRRRGFMRKLVVIAAVSAATLLGAPSASAAVDSVFGGDVDCASQPDGTRFCGGELSTTKTFDGVPIDVNVAIPEGPTGEGSPAGHALPRIRRLEARPQQHAALGRPRLHRVQHERSRLRRFLRQQ